MSSIILSVLIPSSVTKEDAVDWVKSHGYIVRKIHTTAKYLRFRQHTTKYAKKRGYTSIRTIPIGNDGISMIVAYTGIPRNPHPDTPMDGAGIVDIAKGLWYGQSEFTDAQKKLLERYGNLPITSIQIGRTPLPYLMTAVLNIVSLGMFKKLLKASPYDRLYHLFAVVTVDGGARLLVEKNQTINIRGAPSKFPSNTEYIDVPMGSSTVTLSDMLKRSKDAVGSKRFFSYDAIKENCQGFIIGLLQHSGLLTSELTEFIKQDVETLFSKLKYLQPVMNVATGIGAAADIIRSDSMFQKVQRLPRETSIGV
jgi:hypothetical protein